MTELQEQPTGNLRIYAPMSFGTLHLSGVIAEYMALYPDMRVELVLNDRFVDPIEEGFDVTMRIWEPRVATSLITQEIVHARRMLCASPDYLARMGEPQQPTEPRAHRCLHYGYLDAGSKWRLSEPDGDHCYDIRSVMWPNNAEVLRDAAINHQGIAMLPTFIAEEALKAGQLRAILCDHVPPEIELCALYPRHRHLSTKVRYLVDLLLQHFGDSPYWDPA